MGKVVIIGALNEEIEMVLANMTGLQQHNSAFGSIYEGEMYGREVCLIKSGVGKVLTAAATQMLCQLYNIELLIFTGVGGGLNSDYKVGHVCVGAESIQWDLNASAAGFEIGQVPYTQFRIFKSDAKSIQMIKEQVTEDITIHFGMIGTGDTFVSTDGLRAAIKELGCDLVDMETAAMAQVATLHDVPFVAIRSISDTANEKAAESFTEMLPKLAAVNFSVIEMLVRG